MTTALSLAKELIAEIGVEDAWWTIVREGGHHEMLREVNRWRRWARRHEPRGGRRP
ncbi:MAG: hypothetical protein ACOYBT_09830 [Polynucleobacter sp.]